MDHPRFVISADEAQSMAKISGLSVPQLLPTLVKSAQNLARPPISNYHVAAVGLSSDGRIFIGVNLEFPGVPLHHSVHAEQFLVTNHALHNSPRLAYIAVSAAPSDSNFSGPCGHCRQFFQELRQAGDIQILITSETAQQGKKDVIYKPFSSLVPNSFGPCNLLDPEKPLILENHNNGLCFANGVGQDCDKLKHLALEAANASHAPYSDCPSGVALMDVNGKFYKGCYLESVAYTPSLSPVQAALVDFVANGGGGYGEIVAAVVVEKEKAMVRQEDTARLLLKMVSPDCDFRVFHCCSSVDGCV
ncbi:Cytidine deaminase [Heracleum sosnowskyi]|uniref:cytidine deaminase n=1 Tax=Heracleum sosnowskyi TaxID=360622 RepID=A0AAD8HEZ8_9APIA|nr:Cytidine deaminase [Heracleum sosnowskyi]